MATTSTPHPELLPLTEEECMYQGSSRNPLLSLRDYSQEEIEEAIRIHRVPSDMMEYCYNNGVNWNVPCAAGEE